MNKSLKPLSKSYIAKLDSQDLTGRYVYFKLSKDKCTCILDLTPGKLYKLNSKREPGLYVISDDVGYDRVIPLDRFAMSLGHLTRFIIQREVSSHG